MPLPDRCRNTKRGFYGRNQQQKNEIGRFYAEIAGGAYDIAQKLHLSLFYAGNYGENLKFLDKKKESARVPEKPGKIGKDRKSIRFVLEMSPRQYVKHH